MYILAFFSVCPSSGTTLFTKRHELYIVMRVVPEALYENFNSKTISAVPYI
jgi:hypothetical protein